jgi:hypothetical protein
LEPLKKELRSLCHLEGLPGSLADLVHLVLKGVNPALDFLIGRALRRDKKAAILAWGVSQRAILTPARSSGAPGWIFGFKAPKKCMDVSPFALGKFCV